MPIRKELRKFYGREWEKVTRPRILGGAGGIVEGPIWQGSKASYRYKGGAKCQECGVEDRAVILRHSAPEYRGWWFTIDGRSFDSSGRPQFHWRGSEWDAAEFREVKIVITVAHLNQIAGDDRPENLRALCQFHHLRFDSVQHVTQARKTRLDRKDGERPILREAGV